MELLKQMWSEDDGQGLVEYGLLLGIIVVGAIVAILAIGPKVATYFSKTASNLP